MGRIRSYWPESLVVHSDRSGGPDACWPWTGANNGPLGYGVAWTPTGKEYAHRASYEFYVGPIPDGHVLDHTCRNPPCINPTHLEPVLQVENIDRGFANFGQCLCKKNLHDITLPGSVLIDGQGFRRCRVCREKSKS